MDGFRGTGREAGEEGDSQPHQALGHLLQRQTRLDEHHSEFLAEMEASRVVMSSCTGCELHKDALHGGRHHSCSRWYGFTSFYDEGDFSLICRWALSEAGP